MESVCTKTKQQLSLKDHVETETESTLLLASILSTLQRLEQHFAENSNLLSTIAYSVPSNSSDPTPRNDLWRDQDFHMKERPALQTWFPKENHGGIPVTPPDSQAEESPVTPYQKVLSELKAEFAFVESDDESDSLASSTCGKNTGSVRNANLEKPACTGGNLYDNDGSVYSSDLLSSHLAQASAGRTTTLNTFDLSKTCWEQRNEQQSHDTAQAMAPRKSKPDARHWKIAHRGLELKRSFSGRKDRGWAWTKERIEQDFRSSRKLFVIFKEKGQAWVGSLTETTRTRRISLLNAPKRFSDKMTVTKVFYV